MKSLIFLQEVGYIPLPKDLNQDTKKLVEDVFKTIGLSSIVEDINDVIINLQGVGKYDKVIILSDENCTREKLLDSLVQLTNESYTIDLVIWGHGSNNRLDLHGGQTLTGGSGGSIRKLIDEAKSRECFSFNLRMVYMCNCYGSTLNDDWLSIGAIASVGSTRNDNMPLPMTQFFLFNWISGQKVKDAAKNAYNSTIPFYLPFYHPVLVNRTKRVRVTYPCPKWNNPLKMCKKRITIPDTPDLVTNDLIKATKLKVSGYKNIVF